MFSIIFFRHWLSLLTRSADGTEENRVVLLELLESTIGNVFAGLLIGIGAPIVVLELQLKGLEGIGQSIQSGDTSINDLWANSIGWDGGDAVGLLASDWGRHDGVVIKFLSEVT